jgi:hypothetical protein
MMNARFAIVALHASADGLHMSCAILRRRAKNQGYATYNRFSIELVDSNRFYTMLINSKCLTASLTNLPLRSAPQGTQPRRTLINCAFLRSTVIKETAVLRW